MTSFMNSQLPLSAVSEGEENQEEEEEEEGDDADGDNPTSSTAPLTSSSTADLSPPLFVPASDTPSRDSQALPPFSASQPSSSQLAASQQSTGPILTSWPDEFPSLSYLYSDFPEPADVATTNDDDEEAAFQSLARNVPREHQVDVTGFGSHEDADDEYASQQATQVLTNTLTPTMTMKTYSQTSVCLSNANTQVLPSQARLAAAASLTHACEETNLTS